MSFSERGFALTAVVILLPIFISLSLLLFSIASLLQTKEQSHRLCLVNLLKSEYELRKPLKRLFALNPKAQTLRTKRKKAEAAFKVALVSGEPALISTAKAYLIYVKGQQLSLRAKQQSEVMEIQSIANERERQLRKDFQMQYQTHLKSFNNGSFSPQLIFYPPLSLSPSYRLAPFTLEPTTLQARWSIKANHSHFLEHIPFLKNLNSPLSLKGQCATELKLRKDKWHIRIKEGRS